MYISTCIDTCIRTYIHRRRLSLSARTRRCRRNLSCRTHESARKCSRRTRGPCVSLSGEISRKRVTNVCWRSEPRRNGNRPGRAGAPCEGSQSQECNVRASGSIFIGISSRVFGPDTIAGAVRPQTKECAFASLAFHKGKALSGVNGARIEILRNNSAVG